MFNENTQQYETNLLSEEQIHTSSHTETPTDEKIDEIICYYTPKKGLMSPMTCKELPRSWRIQERIKSLNAKWNLTETPGDTNCVQQDIKERLKVRLQNLIKNTSPNEAFRQNHKICVKLSGDGTNVGKRLHVINMSFTILDEDSKAMSADGNHVVAIIKEPEDYKKLAESLSDIRRDVESLKYFKVGTECFDIEWFLGGDWKFLACVCGLGAATASHPCIWCKCPLYKYDGIKVWSLSDTSKGAHTIDEIQEKSKERSQG